MLDGAQDEIALRYDAMIALTDSSPSPLEEMGSLELLKSWREGAWRNAERLLAARTAPERAQVMEQIETYSTAWGTLLAAPDSGSYAETRLAHCRAYQARAAS